MPKVEFDITHAFVLLTDGTDEIYLTTTLPSPMPAVTDQSLHLRLQAAYDTGVEYCRTHLGLEPDEVVSNRR